MKKNININELNIGYIEAGKGENLVFLHGWGQSAEAFAPIIEILKEEYHVWSLDLPGFGDSDEPKTGMTIYDYEKLVAEFIKVNNIDNPTLIGHSFGGRISIIYSATRENIKRIVLTGAAGIVPERSLGYKFKVYHYKIIKLLTKTPFYKQYREDLLNTSGSEDYKNASMVMKDTLIKVVNEDLKYLMPDIKVPAYLYWGEIDDATPVSDGMKINELIEKTELKIIPNKGHYAYLENYHDFVAEISNFFENN